MDSVRMYIADRVNMIFVSAQSSNQSLFGQVKTRSSFYSHAIPLTQSVLKRTQLAIPFRLCLWAIAPSTHDASPRNYTYHHQLTVRKYTFRRFSNWYVAGANLWLNAFLSCSSRTASLSYETAVLRGSVRFLSEQSIRLSPHNPTR